jgi:plastocyanin
VTRWLVSLALLGIAGCASGLHRSVHEVTARADADGVQRVALTTHSFYFEPNRIVVRANVPVEIRLHNGAWLVPHNFSLRSAEGGLEVERDLRWFGGSGVVRFTPGKTGEYRFFCDKDGHAKKGMAGTLVVVP